MNEEQLKNLIRRQIPVLGDRNLEDAIVEHGSLMTIESGEILMDYGQFIRNIPIVLDGVIKVMKMGDDGQDMLLYYLSGGSTCPTAFTCCLVDKKSEIKAIVEETATIISLPVNYIDDWIREFPTWKNFIMHSYNVRFQELLNIIDEIAFNNIDQRLIKYLDKKLELTGKKELKITHKEIASDLNSSREAISRLLKKIEKSGHIKLGRNKIFIHSLPELFN